MEKWKHWVVILLFCALNFEICASVIQEERVLSRFSEEADFETYDALSDWDESSFDPSDESILALHLNDLCFKDNLPPETEKLCNYFLYTGNEINILTETQSAKVTNENAARNNANGIIRHLLQNNPPQKAPSQKPLEKPKSSPIKNPTTASSKIKATIHEKKHRVSWIVYASIGVAICVAFIAFFAIFYFLYVKYYNVCTINPWSTGLSGHLQNAFVTGVPALKRSEIEAACENFSNIIMTLSDSVFYKGTLSNGSEITVISSLVTSPSDWSQNSQIHFRNKVLSLSKVNHKNFMNLVGYCEEEDPFTRVFVFEYAPNGTLFEHLHIKEAEQLDWASRMRIIMGVIYCLEYMHTLNPSITLKTLNSKSIYLTEDYAAKVADPKLFLQNKDPDSDSDSDSDFDSIVYKFGVLLLETISGRRQFSNDDGLLVLWASSYLNGKRPILSMVDSSLKEVNEGQIGNLVEVVKGCFNPVVNERLSVAEVAGKMKGILGISPREAMPRISPLWWAELEVLDEESES